MRAGSAIGGAFETGMFNLTSWHHHRSDPWPRRDTSADFGRGSHCLTHTGLVGG
jgi:hypothetical protein